jgi:hypothetical protein
MFNAPKNSNQFPSLVDSRIFNSISVKILNSIEKIKSVYFDYFYP